MKLSILTCIYVLMFFLASVCCVQKQRFRSSYFQIISQDDFYETPDLRTATVHDVFKCTTACSLSDECNYALFHGASKKCSFGKAKENLKDYCQDAKGTKFGRVLFQKVSAITFF